MYSAGMAKMIQVRDVPEPVHAELTRQAERAGMSLNRYLLQEFERLVRRGRNREVFERAAQRPGKRPTSAQIVEAIRAEREARS
jgi:antitoxin FitA